MNTRSFYRSSALAAAGLCVATSSAVAQGVGEAAGVDLLDWILAKGATMGPVLLAGLVGLGAFVFKHLDMVEDATDILGDLLGGDDDGSRRRKGDGFWAKRKDKKEQDRLASVVIEPYAGPAQPVSPVPEMTHRTAIPSSGAVRPAAPVPAPDVVVPSDIPPATPHLTALQRARQGLPKRASVLDKTDPFEKFAAQIEAQKARLQQPR